MQLRDGPVDMATPPAVIGDRGAHSEHPPRRLKANAAAFDLCRMRRNFPNLDWNFVKIHDTFKAELGTNQRMLTTEAFHGFSHRIGDYFHMPA